jgi:alpha-glucosidase (family GH31 glycosyl hydrolase)
MSRAELKTTLIWFGLLASLALIEPACQPAPDSTSYTLGAFRIIVEPRSFRVERNDGSGAVLLQAPAEPVSAPTSSGDAKEVPPALGWRESKPDVRSAFGMFLFNEKAPPWTSASSSEVMEVGEVTAEIVELRLGRASVRLEKAGDRLLRVSWTVSRYVGEEETNRLIQSFACEASDRFFGLGALVHGTEHRGEVIPAWVSEQGIGKLRREGTLAGFPLNGDIHDSYLPVPFVASSRGFGLLVEESRRSVFHLCPKTSPDRWAVEVWNDELSYLLIDGPSLTGVIERLTGVTGRPRLAPKWAFAPWIDATHGEQEVLAVAQKLREERVPSSAIWTEDWIGGSEMLGGYHLNYRWNADTTLYPDLKGLASGLRELGFRFLGYFNSFIDKRFEQWREAQEGGYLIRDAAGEPLVFLGPLMTEVSLPDLTRPGAVQWLKGYLGRAEALGFDGWMADYGEWLPIEAELADGTTGAEAHNLYPLQWQRAQREFWDEARPDGDYLFFVRSGWSGTGGLAPIAWAGDQQTEFGGLDGLASVVPLMVNAGMSGIPIMTHDIAGYSTVGEGVAPTTRELFYRWTELGALSPVMRTHHGAMAGENWQWHRDAETIDHFRRYARLHVSLFPYRYSLAKEASARGLPMVRHLALHFPSDVRAARVKDQFMLGPYLLVAPVQAAGARSRKVYLPSSVGAGSWFHCVTGERLEGGKDHDVPAALEEIPLFAPAGAMIPTFLTAVDTLDSAPDPLKGIETAEQGPLHLKVFLGSSSSFTIYDGTRLTLDHRGAAAGSMTLTVDGKAWPACSGGSEHSCTVFKPKERTAHVFIGSTRGFELTGIVDGQPVFVLGVRQMPTDRELMVTLRW